MDMVSVCIDYLPSFYMLFLEGSESWTLGELMHLETGVSPITNKILSTGLAQVPHRLQLEHKMV